MGLWQTRERKTAQRTDAFQRRARRVQVRGGRSKVAGSKSTARNCAASAGACRAGGRRNTLMLNGMNAAQHNAPAQSACWLC